MDTSGITPLPVGPHIGEPIHLIGGHDEPVPACCFQAMDGYRAFLLAPVYVLLGVDRNIVHELLTDEEYASLRTVRMNSPIISLAPEWDGVVQYLPDTIFDVLSKRLEHAAFSRRSIGGYCRVRKDSFMLGGVIGAELHVFMPYGKKASCECQCSAYRCTCGRPTPFVSLVKAGGDPGIAVEADFFFSAIS